MDKFEIIAVLVLIFISLFLWRLKTESTPLKNIQTAFGILAGLAAVHFAYVEFIQKKTEKEKLPPVLNVNCKLEKIAETDSCYLVKASVNYENKSERRIYIILSTLHVTGYNINPPPLQLDIDSFLQIKSEGWYSKHFTYYDNSGILYSHMIDSKSWYDFNKQASREFIIKIPRGYEAAALKADVTLANVDEALMTDYIFDNRLSNTGNIYNDIKYFDKKNNITLPIDSSQNYKLLEEYGVCHTYASSQVYLEDKCIKK